jgi:hypothetical protein
MFARTFLAAGFIFISLTALGCASESAPEAQQSDFVESTQAAFNGSAEASQPAQNAEYVSPVMAQQPVRLPPKPSVVQWIGPPQKSVDAKLVQSTPTWPPPTTDQPTTVTAVNQSAPVVQQFDQPIQKADKPALKVADAQPVPVDTAGQVVKVAGDSVNSAVQQAPLALAKLSSPPTADAISPGTVRAGDAIKETQESREKVVKTANDTTYRPADSGRALPPPAMPVLPVARPIPPVTVADAQNNLGKVEKWLPSQPLKVVTFQSMLERLPNESRPLANIGWDGFSIPRAHEWMQDQLVGVELQVAVAIVNVRLIRIPNSKDPDQTIGWELALTTEPERFSAFGLDTFHWPATWKEDVSGRKWRGGEVRFPVTEDFAKQARLWHVGDVIVLSGTVEDVFVEGGMTNLDQPCGRFTTIFKDVHVDRVMPQVSRQ